MSVFWQPVFGLSDRVEQVFSSGAILSSHRGPHKVNTVCYKRIEKNMKRDIVVLKRLRWVSPMRPPFGFVAPSQGDFSVTTAAVVAYATSA